MLKMPKLNGRLRIGIVILTIFVIMGGILPFFSPYDPRSWNIVPRNLPPSLEHFFGTNNLGQDTFWLLTIAIRNSLIIGLLVGFFATLIGVLVGLTAGFLGGLA